VQPQNAYSDSRRVWVDEQLSFNPWHSLAAHRPLGNIMRARFKAYQASSHFRHSVEGRQMVEPRSIEEMPDPGKLRGALQHENVPDNPNNNVPDN
jgi:hypothetical protein